MIVSKLKVGEPHFLVLNGGIEVIARIVTLTGGDLIINGCKKLENGMLSHYPPFSKINSDIHIKTHAIVMMCELDENVRSIYEQYIEQY